MMNDGFNRLAIVITCALLNFVWALDYDQNFDVSAATQTIKSPLLNDVDASLQTPQWQQTFTLSPKLNLWLYPSDSIELTLRYGLNFASTVLRSDQGSISSTEAAGADYLLSNMDASLWLSNSDESELTQQLEQLMLTYWGEHSSLSVGRQTISFGIAKVYSPADMIQPTGIDFSASGYRHGVDAVRFTWFVGSVSELDAGLVVGDDKAAFARLKTNTHMIDFDVTAIQVNDNVRLISLGVIGGIGRFGLWQETALLAEIDEPYLRSTLGVDTTLLDDLYVMAEYHFNGIGAEQNIYDNAAQSAFYQLGAVQPLGKHYLSVSASKSLNPLIRLNANWVTNLYDNSGAGLFSVDASVSDYVSSVFSLTLPYGDYTQEETSEYGAYPVILNVSVNWVF